ncbi:MAG: helix-hairpin-helix domain-containing protein [Lachnospiraceae bacterium]|nr:helix-hairpin-helix domain-containing protein [Lachnospiraceae bacterium]
MQSKESIKKRCGKGCIRKTAVLAAMIIVAMCSGCTGKEELEFSLQNVQSDRPAAEEENGLEQQAVTLSDTAAATESDARLSIQTEICVHVCGAVKKPGVYTLPSGSRVYEAVQAAGGFAENADENYVNQAQQLPDAVQLVIPTSEQVAAQAQEGGQAESLTADAGINHEDVHGETARIGILSQDAPAQTGAAGEQNVTSDDGKININTASESQLCDIPGIGAVRASAIAAYRQEHGAFQTIEDIMKVSGIKQGTYDKIKDSIKVN